MGTLKLSEAVTRYLEMLAAWRRPPLYLSILRTTFRFWLQDRDPPLTEAVANVNAHLVTRLAPLCHNTASMEFHRVRQFLDYCVAQHWIEANPLRILRAPQPHPTEVDVLTDDEIRSLLAAGDHLDRVIILLLLGSGMRLGELERLTWADIHGDEIRLLGKGEKERRVAPGRVALAALASLPLNALPLSRFTIKDRLRTLRKRTGVRGTHAHAFRHTFSDRFIAAGGTVEELSHILGHSNLNTTMIYIRRHQQNRALEAQRRLNPADALLGGDGGDGGQIVPFRRR